MVSCAVGMRIELLFQLIEALAKRLIQMLQAERMHLADQAASACRPPAIFKARTTFLRKRFWPLVRFDIHDPILFPQGEPSLCRSGLRCHRPFDGRHCHKAQARKLAMTSLRKR